ncbi:MAG: hypothetical protein AB7L13_09360 [Acidimicrobiia bacterium]
MDREQRAALWSLHRDLLLRVAYVVCGDVQTAHDAVAVVHGRVVRRHASRDVTVAHLHRWLARALLGSTGWRARSGGRNRSAVEAVARRSQARDVADAHAKWARLLRLPADARVTAVLHVVCGLDASAVAGATGMTPTTAAAMIGDAIGNGDGWREALTEVSEPVIGAPGFESRSQWRMGRRRVVGRSSVVMAVMILMTALALQVNGNQAATGATAEPTKEITQWSLIDRSPLRGRADPVVAWTGDKIVVFGGWLPLPGVTDPVPSGDRREWLDDGAIYDPAADRWETMPRPPVSPSGWQAFSATWTGREVVVVGRRTIGRDGDGRPLTEPFAAAFDIGQRHWRTIVVPASALALGVHSAVWTGSELLIWGYNDALADLPLVELALDPVTSTWRELAPSGFTERTGQAAVWTGQEMIVVGGSGDGIDQVTASAYDPETDAWRPLPDAPLVDRTNAVVAWTGSKLVVWGGQHGLTDRRDGAVYDPVTDAWTPMPEGPYSGALAASVWTGSELVVAGGWRVFGDRETLASVTAFDDATSSWRALPDLPIGTRCRAASVAAGHQLFVWGGLRDCSAPSSTTVASNQAALLG